MWNVKAKALPVITRTILKSFRQKPEQHTGKARNQGTTKNSPIGHCTRTADSTDVK